MLFWALYDVQGRQLSSIVVCGLSASSELLSAAIIHDELVLDAGR